MYRLHIYRDYLGRRGLCLLLFGLLQITTGWSVVLAPPQVFATLPIFHVFPQDAYGWAWIAPGLVAALTAFFRIGRDALGFAASFFMPFLWGLAYAVSFWPRGELDFGLACRGVAVYWIYAALVLVVAGWAEPPFPEAEEASNGEQ